MIDEKLKSLRRLGKNEGNVDFIRKTGYNKKKEWRKDVGLTVTRVVLKYYSLEWISVFFCRININKSCKNSLS